ncbi:hypothetical protein F4806DRAFT_502754 [Annulohypoxylon nitens]|nr:hypothetical protein F4806DRAFT_502754 [Annulohypoxylon nitens]
MNNFLASIESWTSDKQRPPSVRTGSENLYSTKLRERYDGPSLTRHGSMPSDKHQLVSKHPQPDYKPIALRWPFLLVLDITVIVLIILMSLGLRSPPQGQASSTSERRSFAAGLYDTTKDYTSDSGNNGYTPLRTTDMYNSATVQQDTVTLAKTLLSARWNSHTRDQKWNESSLYSSSHLTSSVTTTLESSAQLSTNSTTLGHIQQNLKKPWLSGFGSQTITEWDDLGGTEQPSNTSPPETTRPEKTTQGTETLSFIVEEDSTAATPSSFGSVVETGIEKSASSELVAVQTHPMDSSHIIQTTVANEVHSLDMASATRKSIEHNGIRVMSDLPAPSLLTSIEAISAGTVLNDIIPNSIGSTDIGSADTISADAIWTGITSTSLTSHPATSTLASLPSGLPLSELSSSVYTHQDGSIRSSTPGLVDISDVVTVAVIIPDGPNTMMVAAVPLTIPEDKFGMMKSAGTIKLSSKYYLINSIGSTVATVDQVGADLTTQVMTLTGSSWTTTSTSTGFQIAKTLQLPLPSSVLDWTSTLGNNIPATTGSPSQPIADLHPKITVYTITKGQYFVGMFVPTLVVTILSIPINILDRSLKRHHPFHLLARPQGASGAESLLVKSGSHSQMTTIFRQSPKDSILPILVTILTILTTLLTPFSSEAVGIQTHGCAGGTNNLANCAITLGLSPVAAKITIALLACVSAVLLLLTILLHKWKSGLAADPWSLGGIASLSTHPDMRRIASELPIDAKTLREKLSSVAFRIQHWEDGTRGPEYGICPAESDMLGLLNISSNTALAENTGSSKPQRFWVPVALKFWVRGLSLAFLCGTLVLIVYYQSGFWADSFETFMDSQSFGVRFLFTSIGVVITLFWETFFEGVATFSPFRILARAPADAKHSILLTLPVCALTGVWAGIKRRDYLLAIVASCSVMSQFLPLLLANVPSAVVQTKAANLVCSWMAVTIIVIMIMVLVGSFFYRWPRMLADPTTIMGMMFYTCDSTIMQRFEGLSTLKCKERDRKIQMMELQYAFGERGLGLYVTSGQVCSSEAI